MDGKKYGAIVSGLALIAVLFGCQCGGVPPPDAGPTKRGKLVNEFVALEDEGTAIIKGVVDNAHAEKAMPQIDTLTKRMEELTKRLVALGARAPEDQGKTGEYFNTMESAGNRFFAAQSEVRARGGREISHEMIQTLGVVTSRFHTAVAHFRGQMTSL